MPASTRSPKQPTPRPIGEPAPVDISAGMPRTMRDELTGDFLRRGYDQRMRVEGTNLNIYDSPSRGGALLQSTPMDMGLPGMGVTPDQQHYGGWNPSVVYPWAQIVHETTQIYQGRFKVWWDTFHLGTFYLASNGQNLFMAGIKGDSLLTGSDTPYQNLLYQQLPADGSCASASCLPPEMQVSLPNKFVVSPPWDATEPERAIQVTALAAGNVGGGRFLAVGLSDGGVQIYSAAGGPELTDTFTGMVTGDGSQTPVTALASTPCWAHLVWFRALPVSPRRAVKSGAMPAAGARRALWCRDAVRMPSYT